MDVWWSAIVFVACGLIFFVGVPITLARRSNRPTFLVRFGERIETPFALFFFSWLGLTFAVNAIQSLLNDALALAHWSQASPYRRVATVCVFLIAVAVLYWMRERRRHNYGALEIGFGIAVAWFALGQAVSRETCFAAFKGAAYVVVRGVDNVRASLKPGPTPAPASIDGLMLPPPSGRSDYAASAAICAFNSNSIGLT